MGETTVKSKKPFGFYVCSLGFTFERMAFYTAKYLLAIWLVTEAASGGIGLTTAEAAVVSANFVAYTYITPMIGGYLADYWISPRLCTFVGMVLMGIGYITTYFADDVTMVYVMIALVSIGTGLFKGNLSGINALQFGSKEELDGAFSVQYSFVNAGSFIGTTFITLLVAPLGFQTVFLICGILLLIDAAWFVIGGRGLGDLGKKPFKHDQREFSAGDDSEAKDEKLTPGDYKRIAAILLVTVFSIVFWAVWYMAYLPAYYHFGYGDGAEFMNKANWFIGSFQVPTSWFDSLNALFCIGLGPVLALAWSKLADRPQGDISMFKKTALGIILLASSIGAMVLADIIAGDGQVSILWMVLIAFLLTMGEMVFSPLGNSFISKMAPAKFMGLLLGVWPVAVYFANQLYPPIYAWATTQTFTTGFGTVAAVVAGCGIVLWLLSGTLDKLESAE